MAAKKVSRCRTRGESEDSIVHKWQRHASEGIHPGFKTQGRHHQNSKTGVSVAPEKD